jgi:hypothetical protein
MYTGETVHFVLMVFLTPISFGAMGLVVWWFVRQNNDAAETTNIDQVWAKRGEWGEATCRQIINRQVVAGMSPEMVTLAWGAPAKVEPIPGGETWLYEAVKNQQTTGTVAFRDNTVVEASGKPAVSGKGLAPWLIIAASLALATIVSMISLVVIAVMR